MPEHTAAITAVLALLAAFLIGVAVFKYAVHDNFLRTRLLMSSLFAFIVLTLSISFWPYASLTFSYSLPAFLIGVIIGQVIGVRTEQQKIVEQGVEHYVEHFFRINPEDIKKLTWWSIINFYSIVCGLVLINLIGFTNIILHGSPLFIIATSSIGAFFVGTIVPYLVHLWLFPLHHRITRKGGGR